MASSADYIVQDLVTMTKATNYHQWLMSQFDGYIGNRVLEVGAGLGTYTELLADKQIIIVIDREDKCIEYLNERFKYYHNIFPVKKDIETDSLNILSRLEINTILCFNVLEHIKDDSLLLQKLHSALITGGHLLIVAPAHPVLYGSIDKEVGHYRRYTKKDLLEKIQKAGFKVKKVFYMNFPAVFGWFIVNRILKKKRQSPSMILAYDSLIPLISKIERLIPPPIGLSLAVVAQKQHTDTGGRRETQKCQAVSSKKWTDLYCSHK